MPDNPVVNFELAYLNKDWNKVVVLKDKVASNDRRIKQIIEAYVAIGNPTAAIDYANSHKKLNTDSQK